MLAGPRRCLRAIDLSQRFSGPPCPPPHWGENTNVHNTGHEKSAGLVEKISPSVPNTYQLLNRLQCTTDELCRGWLILFSYAIQMGLGSQKDLAIGECR